jgi:hypothetical protein
MVMMNVIEKLKTIDVKLYPEIWCKFNKWEYPEELIEFKPDNFELLPMALKHKFIDEPMNYISSIISEKELLRCWNKDNLKGVEFDIWYENKKPLSALPENIKKILKALYDQENLPLNN